jgi:hypothetical protein
VARLPQTRNDNREHQERHADIGEKFDTSGIHDGSWQSPPEDETRSGHPSPIIQPAEANGLALPSGFFLSRSSIFLDVENPLDDSVQLAVRVEDAEHDREDGWFQYVALFAANGTMVDHTGFGIGADNRPLIAFTHEGESHYWVPYREILGETPLRPFIHLDYLVEDWLFDVPPGKHHLLVSFTRMEGILSIMDPDDSGPVLEVGNLLVDEDLYRHRDSDAAGDWDERWTEAHVAMRRIVTEVRPLVLWRPLL